MPYSCVSKFEKTIAAFCGAKYGVAVSSCTNAIFLSAMYKKTQFVNGLPVVTLPKRTYIGVACSMKNAGYDIDFEDVYWKGMYSIYPLNIVDSALRLKRNCYISDTLYCLSFHVRKHIGICRGGMILTDDIKAVRWLKQARFDGRHECALLDDRDFILGWNMYLTPEQASRGLQLFEIIKDKNTSDIDDYNTYIDLSKCEVFK